jgi:hypothetical protein
MSETSQTTDEILDSLTGHEETWIAEQFGRPIGEFIPQPGMYRRALIFVLKRRDGVNEDDARNAAMDMRLKDVLDFFPDVNGVEPDAAAAEEIEESGKDEPDPEQLPGTSLTSVI